MLYKIASGICFTMQKITDTRKNFVRIMHVYKLGVFYIFYLQHKVKITLARFYTAMLLSNANRLKIPKLRLRKVNMKIETQGYTH